MNSQTNPRYRWIVLLLCWAAFTMTSTDRSTWGPASPAVSEHLGVPLAAIGVFATCYYIGYVLSNFFGGYFSDWFGGRQMLTISGTVAGALMILFGETSSLPMGLAVQGAIGLFAGVDFAAGLKLIATWFPTEQRGRAMGIFMTATSLGTVIANAIVPSLIESSGWRASYHYFGAVTAVLGILCWVLIRNGKQPDAQVAEHHRPRVRPVLRNRNLLLLGLAGFGGLWGTYGFVTWSNTLMIKGHGINPVDAGIVLVMFAGIAIFIKPITGYVTDKMGRGLKVPTAVIMVGFSLTLAVFGSLTTYTQFLWVAPILGIGAYAYAPLTAALTPALAGNALAGTAAGGVNAFWQLGSVIVPVVVGFAFQATGSFQTAFLVLAIGPLLGAAVMLFIKEESKPTSNAKTPNKIAA